MENRRTTGRLGFALIPALLMLLGHAAAQDGTDPRPVRARPPKFPPDIVDLFSGDARANLPPAPGTAAAPAPDNRSATAAAGPLTWSKIISAEAIEDEIKSYKALLTADLKSDTVFKGGGFKRCRRSFSMLAACFAIAADYDGPVRWKATAPAARDLFAKVALQCSQPSDAAFQEAKLRLQDFESLLRGDTLPASNAAPLADWSKASARQPLMTRMEQAQQQGLNVWTANQAEFTKNADKIRREAMILAALAEVIARPNFEFTDDNVYLGYSKSLQKSCFDMIEGVKAKNFDQTRAAVGAAAKACSNCHGAYRG